MIRINTLIVVVLAVFATLLSYSNVAEQRDALSALNASADQGDREEVEYAAIAAAHDSVLSKPYFTTADFATFSDGARDEQLNAYFGTARTNNEKAVIESFWLPGYKDKARVALQKMRQADRIYSQKFSILITSSTIDDACADNRFDAAGWLDQYESETHDALDKLRAKVQAEIQKQTTAADCVLIASIKRKQTGR